MIKNIVFDLGNVLVTFDPKSFLHDILSDLELEDALYQFYFKGNLWDLYDMDLLTHEDMIQKGIEAFSEHETEIKKVMDNWVKYVTEIKENTGWIDTLKKNGYSVYILSNLPKYNYEYLSQHEPFMKKVDGALYSFEVKKGKPDAAFFQMFLDRYCLDAKECLFIDDKLKNIVTAASLGFHVICLRNPDSLEDEILTILNF
ncbi:MAG: HAD family phosphatase [Faecalicoccus sp.]|nr:HAD family phosphatase [Faecalicoccus sp.]